MPHSSAGSLVVCDLLVVTSVKQAVVSLPLMHMMSALEGLRLKWGPDGRARKKRRTGSGVSEGASEPLFGRERASERASPLRATAKSIKRCIRIP